MVYAKYFRKNGKKIGPYYYKSVRLKNGKIKSVYLGTKPPKGFKQPSRLRIGPALRKLLSSMLS